MSWNILSPILAAGFEFEPIPHEVPLWKMCLFVAAPIAAIGYLLGSIPSGLLISLSRGIDIRKHGSGNIGATNVWRTMGKGWGSLAFLCDSLKGWLAVFVGVWFANHHFVVQHFPHFITVTKKLSLDFAGISAAIGCILGHNFPVWLRFKGGKGVATSLGVIFGMMPLAALLTFALWGIVVKITRYVSVASLAGAVGLPVIVFVLMIFWPVHWWGAVHGWGNFYFAVVAAFLVIKRHGPNIQRLMDGTESRIGGSKGPAGSGPGVEPPDEASPQS